LFLVFINLLFIISLNYNKIESQLEQQQELDTQTVKDVENDWFNLLSGKKSLNGGPAWDIQELYYFLNTNNNTLHATLWLKNLTELDNPLAYPIEYGVQIDSDSNPETGDRGIEYELAIKWDDKLKSWKREYKQHSSFGDTRILHKDYLNTTDFLNGNTIDITIDMNYFNLPDKYKVFFYAFGKKDLHAPYTIDFLRWIYVPPPEFKISVKPDKIEEITANEEKRIQVIASSNVDLNANVNLGAGMESEGDAKLFNIKLKDNKSNIIPKYGKYKTDLGIKLLNDTEGSTSLIINSIFSLANHTFNGHLKILDKEYFPVYVIPSSIIKERVELPIIIKRSPDLIDKIVKSLENANKIIGPLQVFITGIFSIGGIIFGAVFSDKIKKLISNKNIKHNINKVKGLKRKPSSTNKDNSIDDEKNDNK
jgi:hypothetical protein